MSRDAAFIAFTKTSDALKCGTFHLVEFTSNLMSWLQMHASLRLTDDLPACNAKFGVEITLPFGLARIVFKEDEQI